MKTFTADDSTLLDLLSAWEEAPPSLATLKLYDAAIAHIDNRVRQHVAEALDEAVEEVSALHRQLAAEKLRADQGWQRYESANADRNSLREVSTPTAEDVGMQLFYCGLRLSADSPLQPGLARAAEIVKQMKEQA